MALELVSRLFSYRIKLLLEKNVSFLCQSLLPMSAELAISASCLSLTTHSFWFSFIDFQTQAEGCVLNFLILGQHYFVLHTSFFFFFWKNFTLPKESLFPDQSEDPWFRLTGNVHGWFCCCLVGWFLPLLCPWTWKFIVTLPQNMIRATFLSIPHVTCLLRHLACSHRINLVKISLATYYALSGELYSVFRILVM